MHQWGHQWFGEHQSNDTFTTYVLTRIFINTQIQNFIAVSISLLP